MSERRTAIAIVDDDELVRRALSRLVASLACQPMAFASAETFLDGLEERVPFAALIDLHMPGMNGLELLRELTRRRIMVRAIVMTGSEQEDTRKRCLEAGAAAFLNKPVSRDDLAAAIGPPGQHMP